MLCQFERLIYPQDSSALLPCSYMVAAYRLCEKACDINGNRITNLKAVGYGLPTALSLRFDLQGHWTKNSKHGLQYEVETYDEVISHTREGIIAYLSSGQIKGIGITLAERIYDMFGDRSLDVLDKQPDKLLEITGISENKLKKIKESYLASRGARDVIAFLAPHGVSPKRAVRIYSEFGEDTLDIVKKNPYRLSEMAGIGFLTADRIALSLGFERISTERIEEGLLYALTDAETKGNLCLDKHDFIEAGMRLLATPELTFETVAGKAFHLMKTGKIVMYNDCVYRTKTANTEKQLAENIVSQLKVVPSVKYKDLDEELDTEERKLNLRMAPEQREAVKMALTKGLSIITGGPGTGKTLIQHALLDIYKRNNPTKRVCCCAPTGRAARRMEQSTGHSAFTVHRVLGLMANEDGAFGEPQEIEADLILVDEVSMLDIHLANLLFKALRIGAQIVLIGDSDQLPSVGPGAVLSEMIASGQVPVVRLDRVFRQNAGSRIAINAKLIRHGNVGLEYGDDFRFVDSPDTEGSARIISEIYMREVAKFGVDNVALLTPFRQKTETGANALNLLIRDLANPPDATKNETKNERKKFRVGDKVMQTKNHENINNGDVGYITDIANCSNEIAVHVDFGDGRTMEYDETDLDMLDLGYASTIHKSQGSEYSSVIINLQTAHSVMLTRPLIYTAITRSKERVIIVGERRALCIAIKKLDTEKRGTCLALRINKK